MYHYSAAHGGHWCLGVTLQVGLRGCLALALLPPSQWAVSGRGGPEATY